MLALALIVLAIASLNVASLMVARAASHTHDIGVRLALGASNWDIRRQAMAEALVLGSLGAALGLLVAQGTAPMLARFLLQAYPSSLALQLTPDAHVLLVTAVIVIATCGLFGLLPVWSMNRAHAVEWFHGGARIAARVGRLGPSLVAGQVALSMVAAIDAGLLVRTLQHLAAANPGFSRANHTIAELLPRPGVPLNAASPATTAYDRQLVERVGALGVREVGLSGAVPLVGADWTRTITTPDAPGDPVDVAYDPVSPGFLDTLGIRLLEGRDFTWTDDRGQPRVAIVSRSLAERLFAGRSAVGKYLNFGPTPAGQHIEIVGVIDDVRLYDVKHGSTQTLLVSVLQNPESSYNTLVLRGSIPIAALREVVSSLGREYVFRTQSLDEIARGATTQEELAAATGSLFGGIAVALAALGLYGLLMYLVSRRLREFAIRVALGGRAWSIMWVVLASGLRIVAVGAVIGGVAAFASVRWLQSLLYGVALQDVMALSVAPMILAALALTACTVPAVRAAHVDPLVLLREE
jgi:putative ABC transport system permease protein